MKIGIGNDHVAVEYKKIITAYIEEKYGYNADWILNGAEPRRKQTSKNRELSALQEKVFAQLENMNESQVKAVLAFMNALDEIEKSLTDDIEI